MNKPITIRDAILQSHVPVAKLARRAGVTRQTIYTIINGGSSTTDSVSKVAAALGLDGVFFACRV